MQVGQRVVATHSSEHSSADVRTDIGTDIGWFVARQPGVMRFLEDRLGGHSATAGWTHDEVLAIALQAAYAIATMFAEQHGVPPPRLSQRQLEQAEEAVLQAIRQGNPGYAEHQPGLAAWIAALTAYPPQPLNRNERQALGMSLAALVTGFNAAIGAAANQTVDEAAIIDEQLLT